MPAARPTAAELEFLMRSLPETQRLERQNRRCYRRRLIQGQRASCGLKVWRGLQNTFGRWLCEFC